MNFFSKKKSIVLNSVANGLCKDLAGVNDPVFAKKMMGDGVAIEPTNGEIYSPCDGTIEMLYPTGHAVGIKLKDGTEILIHIGIDTVEMNGEGFQTIVKQGEKVKKGQLLISCDLNKIKKQGYDTDIMVLVSSNLKNKELKFNYGEVNGQKVIIELF